MDDCAEKLRESADYLDLCPRQGLMYQAANHVEQLEKAARDLLKRVREYGETPEPEDFDELEAALEGGKQDG